MTDKLTLSDAETLSLQQKVEENLNSVSMKDLSQPLSEEELAQLNEIKEYINGIYDFTTITKHD